MATSELQFLIDLLLNHKLPKDTKKLIADRVGEVEEGLRAKPVRMDDPRHPLGPAILAAQITQAPSTQRLLDAQVMVAAPARLPAAEIDKETGRAMVATGGGTKGPRKF